jgi:DHA1 family tetracycline resistance protein-like MFS transporter
MTQIFGYFSAPGARVHFPGAPFVAAAALTLGSAALFVRALRLAPLPVTAALPENVQPQTQEQPPAQDDSPGARGAV